MEIRFTKTKYRWFIILKILHKLFFAPFWYFGIFSVWWIMYRSRTISYIPGSDANPYEREDGIYLCNSGFWSKPSVWRLIWKEFSHTSVAWGLHLPEVKYVHSVYDQNSYKEANNLSQNVRNITKFILFYVLFDINMNNRLVGLVVSMSDFWSWSRGFDPRHIHKFKMWIRSGTGSTQPREDNWVATWLRSSGSD